MASAAPVFGACPSCLLMIQLQPLNCRVVRCGAKILPGGRFEQFPQHAKQAEIEALLAGPHVGCGTPLEYDAALAAFKVVGWDT